MNGQMTTEKPPAMYSVRKSGETWYADIPKRSGWVYSYEFGTFVALQEFVVRYFRSVI